MEQVYSKKSECTGCWACYNSCKRHAIQMVADEEGFYYPSINQTLCTGCGLCKTVCSYLCHTDTQKVYACFSTQKDLRINSSSGGIIGEISSAVIRLGGVVFGSVFDANFQVMYTYTENEGGLIPMRCSKYVQGRVNDSYRKVEEFLQEKKSEIGRAHV